MFKEFKEFITRGSMIDLAVAFVIGVAFAAVVNSLVKDIIMPPIGLLLGNVYFNNLYVVLKEGVTAAPYASLDVAQKAGAVTINYGLFISSIITFIIVGFVLFLIVRVVNRLRREEVVDPDTQDCPYCFSAIPVKATRCPACTSEVTAP
ncbi:MAG: large conductance mechanosensitive channel protein MscL [Thermoleophilia bacterium]|nr:large conductance mechanosensitive channel protein MscL [Thermoleophilia bacterium]